MGQFYYQVWKRDRAEWQRDRRCALPAGNLDLAGGEGGTIPAPMVDANAEAHARGMTHLKCTAVGVALAVASITGCGDDRPDAAPADADRADASGAAAATADQSASTDAYCGVVLRWTVHELSQFDPYDRVALQRFMDEYRAFHAEASALAPAEVAADWQASVAAIEATLVPVFVKYDYDLARMEAEGTPEEQAATGEPPPDVAAAQDRIHQYEARVCQSGQPDAADVEFAGPADADYCASTHALDEALDFGASDWSPEVLKQTLTSPEIAKLFAAGVAAAPAAIADDVAITARFELETKIPLLARYGYDIRRVLLEGTPAERAILQSWDPAVVDSYRRTVAYEQQWCGE